MSNARSATPSKPEGTSTDDTPTTPQVTAPTVADNRVLSREQLIAIRTKFYQHGHTSRNLGHERYHRSELDVMLIRNTARTQRRKAVVEKEKLQYSHLQKVLDEQRKLVANIASTAKPAANETATNSKIPLSKRGSRPLTRSDPLTPHSLNTPEEEPTTQSKVAPEAVKDNSAANDVPSLPVSPRRRAKPLTRSAEKSVYLLQSEPSEEDEGDTESHDEPKPTPIPEDYLDRFWPSIESNLKDSKSGKAPPKPRYHIRIQAAEPELERGFYVYRPGYGNWFMVFVREDEFYEDPDEYDLSYIFPYGYTEKEKEVVRRRQYVEAKSGTINPYVACENPLEEED